VVQPTKTAPRNFSARRAAFDLIFLPTCIAAVLSPGLLPAEGDFPLPLAQYPPASSRGLLATLAERVHADPFNLVATAIFILAIGHAFLTPWIRQWARRFEASHRPAAAGGRPATPGEGEERPEMTFGGQLLHFLGEVEVVFGLWAVVLAIAIAFAKGGGTALDYLGHRVDFTQPMLVTVVMALASTRPVLQLAERGLAVLAATGGGTVGAWWLSILLLGPLLGSLITEPGAMTISALLLARQFYPHRPSAALSYATIGLLFVNVSVGGTLTHFTPPVVMATGPWHWGLGYMLGHFGWKACVGLVTATLLYYLAFRGEFADLNRKFLQQGCAPGRSGGAGIPPWVTAVQIFFLVYTVGVARYPALFIGGFLFFLGFARATAPYQSKLDLRPPLLVGFFLAGLVVHGGLQGWWLDPVLRSLGRGSLFVWATILTGFNDNAAIVYLATLVPGFTEPLKYAVVAGAVTGGGLTVIANAPNPAGQAILERFFPGGVSPGRLLVAALAPTLILAAAFLLL
jgi:Putative Na+/H+ antiporter